MIVEGTSKAFIARVNDVSPATVGRWEEADRRLQRALNACEAFAG